jgi:hypothetical protein
MLVSFAAVAAAAVAVTVTAVAVAGTAAAAAAATSPELDTVGLKARLLLVLGSQLLEL